MRGSPSASGEIGTRGHVDGGTVSGALSLFRFHRPNNAYPWAWQNASEVTALLVSTEHIGLSPEPAPLRPPTDPTGPLIRQLSGVVESRLIHHEISSTCSVQTKRWVRRNLEKIRGSYAQLKTDIAGFGSWLDWVIENSWASHAARKGGVCDRVFLREVALALEVPYGDLLRIQQLSADPVLLRRFCRHHRSSGDFDLMVDAFVVSAIIRGKYYAMVARGSSCQFLCHQSRESIFATAPPSSNEYGLTNTERYLAALLVSSAFRERRYTARISAWSDGILRSRRAVAEERIDLRHRRLDDVALEESIRVLKLLDIRTTSKWIDRGVDAGLALGVGVLTSFFLDPLAGFAVGMISAPVLGRIQLGQTVGALSQTKKRLRNLAVAEGGLLRRNWRGSR